MRKLYCYADESGQDTKGELFIVSIVIAEDQRDHLLSLCEQIEAASGKGNHKWRKARYEFRLEYLRQIFDIPRLSNVLHYSVFRNTTDYDLATVVAIAKAIHASKPEERYGALIYVDGLTKSKRHEYGSELRKLGVPTRKVQGVSRDESNALIRLADALAGFIRDALGKEPHAETKTLFETAKRKGLLREV